MVSHRILLWFACALAIGAVSKPARAFRIEHVKLVHVRSLVIEVEGRKGTRNYVPEDAGAAAEPKESTDTHADTPEARQQRIDQCMASWDSKTHITKANWRKICERQLSEEPQ